jgi:predicted MFS family arabinose efflux permease
VAAPRWEQLPRMLTDTPATRLATRLSFFAAGFGASCWAPLVPFAKSRLAIDDGTLGWLLLCLGIGSVLIMPATGGLVGRFGSRTVILGGGLGFTLALPLLAVGSTVPLVAGALLLFGASLGAMDVAMNVHAVEVERGSTEPLMSGFHGLFSFGGVVGAGGITMLLASGASLVVSTVVGAGVVLAALAMAAPRYLETRIGRTAPFFVRPRGLVLLLGALAFVAFLVEGAVLDWSALLMTGHLRVPAAQAGIAYAVFSVAMTVGRLTGDRIVATLGGQRVLVLGGLVTAGGLVVVLLAAGPVVALGGFLLVGLGASNIVPVLFTQAGRQTAMPSGLAIASMTAIGYAGILAGPAAMGFVAHAWSLPAAFAMLAALMLLVPFCARPATR